MKKLLFALLIALMCMPESFAQRPSGEEGSLVYVDWGRRSKGCVGFGICDVKIHLTTEDTVGILTMIFTGGLYIPKVEIIFDRQYYDNNKSNFQKDHIVLEEDYVLSKEVAKALKAPANYRIKAGKYKINFDSKSNTYNCTF